MTDELDRLREENAALRKRLAGLTAAFEEDHELVRLEFSKGENLSMEMRGPLFTVLAAEARGLLKGCSNYIELRFRDDLGDMSCLIQRTEGETPAVKNARLEKENAELRAALAGEYEAGAE